MNLLSGFLPIWAITAAGWAAGRFDVLGGQAQFVLARFAFVFAMPALLFLTLSRTGLSRLATPGIAVFGLSLLLMFGLGLALSHRVFRRRPADRAIGAMAGSYVNSANLGIPVAVQLLGDASFVIAIALFQTLFVTPVVIALIELDTGGGRRRPLRLLLLPLRNPVIAASAAGTAVAALGLRLPPQATAPVEMLGGAAVPAALFALGLSLHRRREDAAPGVSGGAPAAPSRQARSGSPAVAGRQAETGERGLGEPVPAGEWQDRGATVGAGGRRECGGTLPAGRRDGRGTIQAGRRPDHGGTVPAGGRPPRERPSPTGKRAAVGESPPGERADGPAALAPVRARRAERYVLVLLKTVVHPLLAYALARAFRLDGHELYAVVLCAGLPTAQNAFVYAAEYRLDTALVRDAVLLSTVLSTASLSVITWLLAA